MKLLTVFVVFLLSMFFEVDCKGDDHEKAEFVVGDECSSDDDCHDECIGFGGSRSSCSEMVWPRKFCYCYMEN